MKNTENSKTISTTKKTLEGSTLKLPRAQQEHVHRLALASFQRYKARHGDMISVKEEVDFCVEYIKGFIGIESGKTSLAGEDGYFLGRHAGAEHRHNLTDVKEARKAKRRFYDWSKAEQLSLPMKLISCVRELVKKKLARKPEYQHGFDFIEQLEIVFKFVGVVAYEYAKSIKKGDRLPRGKAFVWYA